MKVALYAIEGNKRAYHIAKSMAEGLRHCGVEYVHRMRFSGVEADIAIAYGWTHEPIFSAYKGRGGHYACWDLGYWNRRPIGDPQDGYHRLSIDAWDTINNMTTGAPDDRFRALDVDVKPDYTGGNVFLVAGMSAKAAGTHGYAEGEWEEGTVATLRRICRGYRIDLRPKPSKKNPISERIEDALVRTRMLVTHHSNVAVDALVAGIPVYAIKGIGKLASPPALTEEIIEHPFRLSEAARRQLLADTAYAQWTPREMRSGAAWEHIKRLLK